MELRVEMRNSSIIVTFWKSARAKLYKFYGKAACTQTVVGYEQSKTPDAEASGVFAAVD